MEQIIALLEADRNIYFFKTHGGAELDCLLLKNGKRYGFEFKFQDAPACTKSMHIVIQDLKLTRLWVIYPGENKYPISDKIDALPLQNCLELKNDFDRQ